MKKNLKISLIIVGVVVVIIIGLVLALTVRKDLGVRYTKADVTSVNNKLGISYGSLPASNDPKTSLKLSGKKALDSSITQSELTALLNQPSSQWKNYPISNVQLKINDDGTVEMTGNLLMGKFNDYAAATNMPDKYTSLVKDKAGLVPVNPSFYYKGDYSVKNNRLEGSMTDLKIGPVEVPAQVANENQNFINGFVEDRLNSAGMSVESATFSSGKLDIKGTIPEKIDFEN